MPYQYQDPFQTTYNYNPNYTAPQYTVPTMSASQGAAGNNTTLGQLLASMGNTSPINAQTLSQLLAQIDRWNAGFSGGYGNTGPMLPSNVNASNLYGGQGGGGLIAPVYQGQIASSYAPSAVNQYQQAYQNYLQTNAGNPLAYTGYPQTAYGNPTYRDMGTGFTWQPLPGQYYGGPFMPQQVSATPGGQYDMRIWAPGQPWQTATSGYGNYSPTNMPWVPPAQAPTTAPAKTMPQSVTPPGAQKATAGPSGAAYANVYQDPNAAAMNAQVNAARKEKGVAPYLGYDPLGIPYIQSTNRSTPPVGWGGSTGVLTNLTKNAPTPAALPNPAQKTKKKGALEI